MKKLGIILAAVTMLLGSAHAADWNFYGSARVSTFTKMWRSQVPIPPNLPWDSRATPELGQRLRSVMH